MDEEKKEGTEQEPTETVVPESEPTEPTETPEVVAES